MLSAALPWTYWLTLPLLATTAAVLIGFALVYLKKVVEPHVLYVDAQAAARAISAPTGTGGQVRGAPYTGEQAGRHGRFSR